MNKNKELNFLFYGDSENIQVILKNDTIWATQKAMAKLFEVDITTINSHLANIYRDGELNEYLTIGEFPIVQIEGEKKVNRVINYYNLDAIISVGYRVNSRKATNFRIWATGILREYMTKGFAMDDERLKQGGNIFGKDYFRELLERVRSIRASERRIWLQLTDIFREISADYDKNSAETKDFYATVQNKFHFAITGQTAAEIIAQNADAKKKNMGLTTWKNSPDGRILLTDAKIAKNYLTEKQIRTLEREVSGFFDYIEGQIEREKVFKMADFAKSIDKFLEFNDYKILDNKGKISRKNADEKATNEYLKFNKTQKINSDFEKKILREKKMAEISRDKKQKLGGKNE